MMNLSVDKVNSLNHEDYRTVCYLRDYTLNELNELISAVKLKVAKGEKVEQMRNINVIEGMKIGTAATINGYIVKREDITTWRIREPSGDWITSGSAKKIFSRLSFMHGAA